MAKIAHSGDADMDAIERQGRAHATAEHDIDARYVALSMAHFNLIMAEGDLSRARQVREEKAELRKQIQSGHREWSCHTGESGRE